MGAKCQNSDSGLKQFVMFQVLLSILKLIVISRRQDGERIFPQPSVLGFKKKIAEQWLGEKLLSNMSFGQGVENIKSIFRI